MSTAERLHVGLIFGGRPGEHEISIRSARSVANAIDRRRFDLTLIGIDRDGRWHLQTAQTFQQAERDGAVHRGTEIVPVPSWGRCRLIDLQTPGRALPEIDVVFPVLHGPFGEDGTIQGLLEMLDVPYVGADVLGSAIGMDKDVQKRLLRDAGLPVVPFEVVTRQEWKRHATDVRAQAERLGSPIFVKPANLGSSLGISKVSSMAELDPAVDRALAYDKKVLLERGIDAREIECSVLGNDEPRASIPGEIVPGEEFYSYEDKYSAKTAARLLIPAPITDEIAESIRTLAVRVFQTLECAGMARIDFFLERENDGIYVNELNTIPGFTSISMYPRLWEASGIPHSALMTRLIDLAIERHQARAQLSKEASPRRS